MSIEELKKELAKFKFSTAGRAQFSDVDLFGVVHNVKYLYWLENARLDYFENVGIAMHPHTISKDFPIMVVETKINYYLPLRFTQSYEILTRVKSIKNSSFVIENIVLNESKAFVAYAKSAFVHLDKKTFKSERIPDNIRELIKKFEGDDLTIAD